jgi:predicted Ser/Thr protein kinase
MDAPIVLVEARNTIEFKYVEGRPFGKKVRRRTQRRTVI